MSHNAADDAGYLSSRMLEDAQTTELTPEGVADMRGEGWT
jgi:hypothetical protein